MTLLHIVTRAFTSLILVVKTSLSSAVGYITWLVNTCSTALGKDKPIFSTLLNTFIPFAHMFLYYCFYQLPDVKIGRSDDNRLADHGSEVILHTDFDFEQDQIYTSH